MKYHKLKGKIGYFIREMLINLNHWLINSACKRINKAVDWLDSKPNIAYWRKKDRGA
jgi:hypothetical protein